MLQWINVSSGYDKNFVLREVDLTAHRGETLAIIGLNGSGKSTLLKTALGLLKPKRGEIFLDHKPLEKYSLSARAQKISLLESRHEIVFAITVYELLEIAARLHHVDQKENLINQALTAVGLQGFENKNLLELSSGEIRRALMAHTLCSNSSVIMLDEPFAHLDWNHQHELVESLKSWQKIYNTTFVLAVHELEWAAKVAHRICVLNRGQVVACEKPETIFQNPLVCEVFAFQSLIDENPIDGSRRLTLGFQPRN